MVAYFGQNTFMNQASRGESLLCTSGQFLALNLLIFIISPVQQESLGVRPGTGFAAADLVKPKMKKMSRFKACPQLTPTGSGCIGFCLCHGFSKHCV